MGFHSVDSDLQIPRDRFVAQTQGEQPKDLIFAARQHVPLWSLGEESRYRRPQVVAAAKKRPDTCKEVANWRAGQQETMDALLECGSNRMLASLGGDHEDTGQLQVFRELNALPNLGESGRRRAVCDHDVDILIDADGVFLEDFDVLLSRKGCASRGNIFRKSLGNGAFAASTTMAARRQLFWPVEAYFSPAGQNNCVVAQESAAKRQRCRKVPMSASRTMPRLWVRSCSAGRERSVGECGGMLHRILPHWQRRR